MVVLEGDFHSEEIHGKEQEGPSPEAHFVYLFEQIDTDRSGTISVDEFYEKCFQDNELQKILPNFSKREFYFIDRDFSGDITKDEFMKHIAE